MSKIPSAKPLDRVLWVRGLDKALSDQQVREEIFRGFDLVDFLRNATGNSETVFPKGFVLMASREEASRAIKELNGRVMNGKALSLQMVLAKKCPKMTSDGFVRKTTTNAVHHTDLQSSTDPNPTDPQRQDTNINGVKENHQGDALTLFRVPFPEYGPTVSQGPTWAERRKENDLHVLNWMSTFTGYPIEFIDAHAPPAIPAEIYHEWLIISESSACALIKQLDAFNTRYRHTGMKYHCIRYAERQVIVGESPEERSALQTRVADLYETDIPWTHQDFFVTWAKISEVAQKIITGVPFYQGLDNTAALAHVHAVYQNALQTATNAANGIKKALDEIELLVRLMSPGGLQKFGTMEQGMWRLYLPGTEGSMFRAWISTLDEVQSGHLSVERMVFAMIMRGLHEKSTYWQNQQMMRME